MTFALILVFSAGQGQSALEIEEQIRNSQGVEKIDLQHQLALKLVGREPIRARLLATEYLQQSKELSYPKGEIQAIYLFGILNDIRGVSDSSKYYFTMGYELSRKHGLKELEANGVNNLGMMNWNLGYFNEALSYFLEALRLYESIPLESGIAKTTSNIGLIYQELRQHRKALGFNLRALELRLKTNNNDHIARSYNNIGICYKNLNKLDSALYYFEKGLVHAEKDQSGQVMAQIFSGIANIHHLRNDFEKSITYYEKSLELASVAGFVSELACYANLTSLYNQINKPRKALYYGLKGDSIINANQLFGTSTDLTYNLGETYLLLKKPELARTYFMKWRTLNDSLYSEKVAKAVAEMQEKYETEKKEQEITILKTESEIKELQIAQNRLTIVAITGISLAVIIIFFLVARHRNHKLQTQLVEERASLQKERFRTVLDAEENERKRVARELHDGLGQMLSTVRLFVSDMGEPQENVKIARSLSALDTTISEVRNISHNMMPLKLIDKGLISALEDMAARINESGQINVSLSETPVLQIEATESIAIYRSVQEIVNNTLRYAKATSIQIQIFERDTFYSFKVSDNGIGFDTQKIGKTRGIGWSNIFSRMELIGGSVQVKSSETGTTVELSVPTHQHPKAVG